MEYIYINNKNNSNKFWSYTVAGSNKIILKWGRLGTKISTLTKTLTPSALRRIIDSKIKKGYELVTKEKLKEESELAKKIGINNKITKIKWMSSNGSYLESTPDYDPTQYIFVEIYNSSLAEKTAIIFSKAQAWKVIDYKNDNNIKLTNLNLLSEFDKFNKPIREILLKLSDKVIHVVKTIKFGAMGVRKINGINIVDENEVKNNIINEAKDSTYDESVIEKFMTLGKRKINL